MIRSVQNSDMDRLVALWMDSLSAAHRAVPRAYWEARAAELRRRCLSGKNALVYLESGQRQADGLVLVSDDDFLVSLFVAPGAQGRGAGSELMEEAKRGRSQLQVTLFAENLAGRYFCQKHGFVEVGRELCAETGQDRLAMAFRGE